MNKESRIYVSGHTGMVGSSIIRRLKILGYNNIIAKKSEELDLRNQICVARFFEKEKPEYVFLAAAKVGGIGENIAHPASMLYDNLAIQNNVLQYSYKSGVKKLVFLGSSCIYPRLCPQPMKEEYLLTGPLEPTNEGYALAKIVGLKMCEYYNKQYFTNFISIMPCNLYGINDHYNESSSHVMSSLIKRFYDAKMKQQPEVVVWGTGNARREFLFIDDFAEACVYLMEVYNDNTFINVGSGTDITIKDLAQTIANLIDYNGKISFDTKKPDGMPQKVVDVSRVNELGWKSSTTLKEGIKLTLEDYLKQKNV